MRPPISQPTVALPIATFTRPGVPSVSFSRSIWTGISFTRTIATSYTFAPTFTYMTTSYYPPYIGGCYNGYAGGYYGNCYGGYYGFIQYPPSYDDTAGSFTLDQTLNNQNGVPCLYYTYFTFDAYAGQQLQAKIWTNGSPISYVVVPSSLIPSLQQAGCSVSYSQSQSFSSQTTMNWTAAQNGEYAVVFYSTVPYNGPVYFQP